MKTKVEIACANSTSTSASVRTLAAVAIAKAEEPELRRERAHEAGEQRAAPLPAIAREHRTVAQRQIEGQQCGLQHQAAAQA